MAPLLFFTRLSEAVSRTPLRIAQGPGRALQIVTATSGETPYEVCFDEAVVRLRRYDPTAIDLRGNTGNAGPVPLVVYPFINDPSILDFRPDRSVIGGFLNAGFTVYVLEWNDASAVDRRIDLGDVCTRYLPRCIGVARRDTGAEDVHLLGYSVSAPIAASFAGIDPDRVRALVLLGPPLDFSAGEGIDLLRRIAADLNIERIEERFGAIPPALIEGAFVLRKPVEYAVTNPARLWDHLDDAEYVEDYGRKLAWIRGGPAVPGAMFREFVEKLIAENRLVRDDLVFRGTHVDLEAIPMPVLLYLGTEDAFVPPEASRPFLDAVPSTDTETVAVECGHVGLSVAPVAHDRGWPAVREWVADRS